jgi:hypothetical protein
MARKPQSANALQQLAQQMLNLQDIANMQAITRQL